MNRRNFFKAAGAVMVGGLVDAQVQASTPTYEWDLSDQYFQMLPYLHRWHNSSEGRHALRMAREAEDRALRLERMRQDHEAQLEEARCIDAMRLEQMKEMVAQSLVDILASHG